MAAASPRAGPSTRPIPKTKTKLNDIELFRATSPKRLKSIYSDISRQRVSNPAAYTSNLDWWKGALEALVCQGLQQPDSQDVLILNVSPNLTEKLRYDGVGKPLGVATVISELRKQRVIIPLDVFQSSQATVYADNSSLTSRLTSALTTPLWWALESLSLIDNDAVESEPALWSRIRGKHVVVSLLKRAGSVVAQKLRERLTSSPADALYDYDSFKSLFSGKDAVLDGVALSENDLKALVRFLGRDQGVIIADKTVIKVISVTTETALPEITAVDRGILELKKGVENMELQVEDLNQRISEATAKANACIRAKRKDAALSHLKTRKFLEEVRSKRLGSLEVLQSTLLQVEAASQDIEIMSKYESSTSTLKTILSHPSLQRDAVEATLEAMADTNALAREVDEAIRGGVDLAQAEAGAEIDEDEIQKELEALIAEDRRDSKAGVDDNTRETRTEAAGRLGEREIRELEESRMVVDRVGGVAETTARLSEGQANMPEVPTGPVTFQTSSELKNLAKLAQLEDEA